MIRVYEVTAALEGADEDAVTATLSAQLQRVADLYPALRSASVTAAEGVLRMRLRVSGRDQWATSRAARIVATSMLRRVKIDATSAAMQLVEVAASGRNLRKDAGRSVPAAWQLDLPLAPVEPQ
jgi:ribose 1,5-bisphosphokinase PhnN